jgi:uncharacterized membrane protein
MMTNPEQADQDLPHTPELTQLSRSEFIAAIVHLYRGELGEAAVWRSRIDTTTHWAIVLSATTLTFILSDKGSDRHVMIPIVGLFVTFLLMMEARRYRFFDIWRSRVRLLEINFYRPILNGTPPEMTEWAQMLAHDLQWPHTRMPWWEAAGRRLRRNYQWIYIVLLASWFIVLTSHPEPTTSVAEIVARAAVGPIPGIVTMGAMFLFYAGLLTLGGYSYWSSRIAHRLPAGHPGRLQAEYRKRE